MPQIEMMAQWNQLKLIRAHGITTPDLDVVNIGQEFKEAVGYSGTRTLVGKLFAIGQDVFSLAVSEKEEVDSDARLKIEVETHEEL